MVKFGLLIFFGPGNPDAKGKAGLGKVTRPAEAISLARGRFHQHFTCKFFKRKSFTQIFSITFWLHIFLAQGYRQKS